MRANTPISTADFHDRPALPQWLVDLISNDAPIGSLNPIQELALADEMKHIRNAYRQMKMVKSKEMVGKDVLGPGAIREITTTPTRRTKATGD